MQAMAGMDLHEKYSNCDSSFSSTDLIAHWGCPAWPHPYMIRHCMAFCDFHGESVVTIGHCFFKQRKQAAAKMYRISVE